MSFSYRYWARVQPTNLLRGPTLRLGSTELSKKLTIGEKLTVVIWLDALAMIWWEVWLYYLRHAVFNQSLKKKEIRTRMMMPLKCHTTQSIKTETDTCPLNVSWWTLQSLLSVLRLQETGNLFALLTIASSHWWLPILLLKKCRSTHIPVTLLVMNEQTCT
jgi:hypothetical protein